MKILNLNDRKRISFLLLLFLSIPSLQIFMLPRGDFYSENTLITNDLSQYLIVSEQKEVLTESQSIQFNSVNKIKGWNNIISDLDKNNNGITDIFDTKLRSFQSSNIPIIIQFPEVTDISLASSIFKTEGGEIKFTYNYAIKGFSGTIDYTRINEFCNQLRENNIEFLIEEDHKVDTHLYYTSRNMNLRPYVWKSLTPGYDGDDSSSIAILDTGIDESHEFFDNYSFGLFTNKIVGWRDFSFGGDNNTVSDNDGHGSHCAGIAAGMGTPVKDGLARSVATHAENRDYTGLDIDEGSYDVVYFARFNVPSLGEIEIEGQFNETTPFPDFVLTDFYLFRNDIIVAEMLSYSVGDFVKNFTYNVDSNDKLGDYFVAAVIYFLSGDADNTCTDANVTVRAEVHWPFAPSTYGCGNLWKGVAPDTHLVGVKVIPGGTAEILKGIDWVIGNRTNLNITVMSMSLGLVDFLGNPVSEAAVIDAVNNAVENGIVTVVSAGNDGVGGNKMGSPADADNVITVAANNFDDQIAYYSSQGGSVGNTIKPDITAPGGSGDSNDIQIFSADTNDNDAEGAYPTDAFNNDLWGAQGTSMSCPAVAGAANLLIEAMGGANKWDWNSGSKSKLVKALLLMTATETYPLKREGYTSYSPTLNRGGKDVHEGYGRINVDAAIEAWIFNWTTNITNAELLTANLETSKLDSFGKHAKAGFVELDKDNWYIFNLSVPSGADYDLYLYNSTPDDYGQPILIRSGTSSIKGEDEIINYTAEYTGKYFLVIKAIGSSSPPISEEDDDKKSEDEAINLLDFLLSPLGLLIIGTCVAVVIVITILAKRSGKSGMKEKEKIRQLIDESYY